MANENKFHSLEKIRNFGIIAHNGASARYARLFGNPRFLTPRLNGTGFLHRETAVSPTPFGASMCAI